MSNVLITGGAGFIGSNLARALRAKGDSVTLLDNFNSYYNPSLKRANVAAFANDPDVIVVEGDVRDPELVNKVVVEHEVDKIAHLAAMAGVRNSIDESALYFDVNLMGSLNLMEAARKHNIKQFVQASTSSVYGATSRVPFVEEDAADRPLASYPASKRSAEMMGHTFFHLFGLNVTCLRFFNVYGPNGRPDMMPMRVMKAVTEDTTFPLFNGGRFSRDWTYIDDIVDGVISALERPLGYEVINLGCGAPISMIEFVEIIEELSGKTPKSIDTPAPKSDPPITFCDNSKARRLLAFNPTVNVAEGLARTWDWFIHNR